MDVYKVGVVMSLKNGVSAGLRVMLRDVSLLQRAIGGAQQNTLALRKAMLATAGASAALGVGTLAVYEKLVKAGAKVVNQQQAMAAVGVSPAAIAANTKAAFAASTSLFNVSPDQAMKMIGSLRGLFGSSAEARAALIPVLKAQVGMDAALGNHAGTGLVQALKALDISGGLVKGTHISVSKLTSLLPAIEQVMLITHGLLSGATILRTMQQAGPAATVTSFKKLLTDTAEASMALGPAVGRGLFMGYKLLFAGQANALQARTLTSLGLLPPSAVHKIQGSFMRIIDTSKLLGSSDLTKNGELSWIHNVVIPRLQKEGYKTNQQLIQQLTRILPSSTGARLISWVVNNWPQRERLKKMVDQGINKGDPYQAAQGNWTAAVSNFSKAWGGLMTVLGVPQVKAATSALNWISTSIHHLTDWFTAHKGAAKFVGEALLALAAGFAAIGAVLAGAAIVAIVGSGGIIAALVAGFVAIGGVLVAFNWKAVTSAFHDAVHGVAHALFWIIDKLKAVWNALFHSSQPAGGTPIIGVDGLPTIIPPIPPPANHAASGSMPVHVTNPHDIAHSVSSGLGRALTGNQTGRTGFNGIMSPYGTPAFVGP